MFITGQLKDYRNSHEELCETANETTKCDTESVKKHLLTELSKDIGVSPDKG